MFFYQNKYGRQLSRLFVPKKHWRPLSRVLLLKQTRMPTVSCSCTKTNMTVLCSFTKKTKNQKWTPSGSCPCTKTKMDANCPVFFYKKQTNNNNQKKPMDAICQVFLYQNKHGSQLFECIILPNQTWTTTVTWSCTKTNMDTTCFYTKRNGVA